MQTASQIYAALRRFQDAYGAALRPLCERAGMAQGAVEILLFLANNPGLDTARDICLYRRLKPSLVSLHVENLVREGYLERYAVPGDRRKCGLRCTGRALPIIREGQTLQQDFMRAMSAGVPAEDLAVCLRCMRAMDDNLARMAGE